MSQAVEMEATITDFNFESAYAELEAPPHLSTQELPDTSLLELETQPHSTTQSQTTSDKSPLQPSEAVRQDLHGTEVPELESQSRSSGHLPHQQSTTEIKDMIIRLERQSTEARTRHDNSIYNTFLAPGSKVVSSEGVVKEAISEKWRRWRSPQMSKITVLSIADNAAIIYYNLEAEDYHKPGWPTKQLRTSTWMKVEGQEEWKRISHQITIRK